MILTMKSNNLVLTSDPVIGRASLPAEEETPSESGSAPVLSIIESEEAFGVCDLDGTCH